MKDGTPQGLPLGEALRAAHSPEHGCPPPEAFLSWEAGDLSDEERRRLDEHVAGCPACAAERDLARLFEPPSEDSEEMAARREDMDFILARLEKGRPASPRAVREAKVVPFPAAAPARSPEMPMASALPAARRRSRFLPAMGLAAAAMLALVFGLLFQMRSAPPLPEPGAGGGGGVMRGADLAVVAPVGEIAAVPSELRWEEIPAAHSYRWRLLSVDGSVVWEETASGSPVRLPQALVRSLHPAVAYTWTVEALDTQGDRIATSTPARFRVRPAGENGSTSR
ncbi:MAG TPA: zf-HC2 domain-containing protein [Thermoanaerobaculia bacterium]|nr:zf-HC2 domain-containing protein [Thermoanaerobaculia bacterium]